MHIFYVKAVDNAGNSVYSTIMYFTYEPWELFGTVIDAETETKLAGVMVEVYGTKLLETGVTDANGDYYLITKAN